jgi:hypothetical protein
MLCFGLCAGLGHDYESVLAVSPVQKWMTLGAGEMALSEIAPLGWELIQEWLVPMARKLGYKPFYSEYRTKRHFSRQPGMFEDEDDEDEEEG